MDAFAEILVFEVAGQRHALPIGQVRELLPALSLTPLPDAPPCVEGVINLRGAVVPVVNVRQRFGLPARVLTPTDHFIVACIDETYLVLHVDRALELMQVEQSSFGELGMFTTEHRESGRLVKCADGLVHLHEVRHFLPSGLSR